MSIEIINGVCVEKTIDSNGKEITHFKPIKENKKTEELSFWQKIKNFFVKHKVTPYVCAKDLNNSEDDPYANKPKTAYEVGIKITF